MKNENPVKDFMGYSNILHTFVMRKLAEYYKDGKEFAKSWKDIKKELIKKSKEYKDEFDQ